MNSRSFCCSVVLLLLSTLGVAQRHCATDRLHEELRKDNPELYQLQEDLKQEINHILEHSDHSSHRISAATDTFQIPVVVHVIYNGISSTNISDAQILSQIDVLNEDFRRKPGTNGFNTHPSGADVEIEFCLANTDPNGNFTTGITRKFNARSFWTPSNSDEVLLKSLVYWPSDQYLNIWVCRLDDDYLGYAQYPGGSTLPGPGGGDPKLDGVVIDYRAFGRTGVAGTGSRALYNLGRTTTHEVGHWLGLLHIWGENEFTGCTTDYVIDTPSDSGPNDDADCIDSSLCPGDVTYVQDLTSNYLDYSPDVCMNMFTSGQKLRMRTVMQNAPSRLSLLSSLGCCIPPQTEELPVQEDFEDGTFPIWKVLNPNVGSPQWEVASPGAYGTSSNSLKIDNDLAPSGQADVFESNYIKLKDHEPALSFDLAYARNGSAVTDCLVVSYSLNCNTWFPLYTLYGDALASTSRITDNFTPLDSEWKKIRIDLEALNDKPVGRIRFENYSNGINTLYLDNINIYKTSESLVVVPYPNPTTGLLNVEVVIDEPDNIKFELFDAIGQKVFEETDYQQTSYTKTLQISGIARGIYILRVSDRKQRASRKILYSY